MSKYPNLTDADSIIMEILWRDGGCSSSELTRELESKLKWTRQTVRTYLARLIDKGLVAAREVSKRVYHYYPVVSREEYAADKSGSILHKYYGSLSHMVAGIVQNEKISDNELDELERLIQRLRNQ
jgi:BlaI family penicillinase repressor